MLAYVGHGESQSSRAENKRTEAENKKRQTK